MNSKPPFFSVIIATYNRAGLLKRALNSLFNQTESDWEALIIDDGSADETEDLIKIFRRRKDLVYHKQKHQGFITAKNNGIFRASGQYVTFLDSDDEYLPEHLMSRKQILQKNRSIEFLHGGVQIIGNPFVPDCFQPHRKIHVSKCAVSGTFFVKREIAISLKGFAGTPLNTDADFLERVEASNLTIAKVKQKTYVYHREGGDSVTKQALKKFPKAQDYNDRLS